MLTNKDLTAISELIDVKLKPILTDLQVIKKDVKKIKDVSESDFGFHEKQNLHVIQNVRQIQKHLGIPAMAIDPQIVSSF